MPSKRTPTVKARPRAELVHYSDAEAPDDPVQKHVPGYHLAPLCAWTTPCHYPEK